MPPNYNTPRFIQFLKKDLALSDPEISVILRDPDLGNGPLSILLWKYGLITIDQLSQIFDWLEYQATGCPVIHYTETP
ncbi:MAG: DUF2949 domain-containing protein [Leptolyngbyaceae bacterium]|nr:DUF2949 domain-containing protein [Leptolyngbyaceae bacterium]